MSNGKERFSFILTEQGPANCEAHESGLALFTDMPIHLRGGCLLSHRQGEGELTEALWPL